jgi:Ca-activated chloride channel family protein
MRGAAEGAASKAELEYRKATAADAKNPQAMYNLGCALLAQNKDSLAYEMFEKAAKTETSKQRKAMAYHNMGVIMQKQQQYGPAMEQYMQSLRLRPHDNQTRYNYVLCKKLKKDQDNNQNGGGGQNNDQNKDQNKDKNKDKDKDKNKDQDKNKDKNEDKQNKDNQQQEPPKDGQMSKENAEQLLNAAMQEEKATQQRLQKAMSQPRRRNIEKNW